MRFTLKKGSDSRRPDPATFKEPVLRAISYGITAPSPHNTQAWFIDVLSDIEIDIYTKHLLPETDPPARQILIGTGCFIELLAIGMSNDGYQTRVEYLPRGDFQVESHKLTTKPVAKITLIKTTTKSPDILYDFINLRHSNRRPYEGNIITEQEFNALITLIGITHSELIFINDPVKMKPYQDIFSKAMELETRTFVTNEETRGMFRFSEKERKEKRDGLSLAGMGLDGIIRYFAEKSLHNGDSTVFNSEKMVKSTMDNVNKAINSAKGLVFLKTSANNKVDWIKTGRDFARFNVAVAKLGLVTSHYNQVIQEYPAMQPLQKEFYALMKTNKEERIQLVARIGRAKPTYQTWRKNVSDYILKK